MNGAPRPCLHVRNVDSREVDPALAPALVYFRLKGGLQRNLPHRGPEIPGLQRSVARHRHAARKALGSLSLGANGWRLDPAAMDS